MSRALHEPRSPGPGRKASTPDLHAPFADYPQFAAHVLGPSQCKSQVCGFISSKSESDPIPTSRRNYSYFIRLVGVVQVLLVPLLFAQKKEAALEKKKCGNTEDRNSNMETNATRILARPVERTNTGGQITALFSILLNAPFLSAEDILACCCFVIFLPVRPP